MIDFTCYPHQFISDVYGRSGIAQISKKDEYYLCPGIIAITMFETFEFNCHFFNFSVDFS
jgi:hypothetical protein